ncbi:hypothetical protein K469DRAFT_544822 [Zopfia rhizophila CBS 207.26]|uniref:Zn(2)-C6 fungal-type domain-containing protein n=1 Tax=Zopfia rhizophila CBS 207.26 TaxID=1314779 RepID=A0A6A6F0Z2_9PEZI|nr:hypothetical protein K469DRAFT_544822 [Zopfia rhizophila CBS 207.26]
MDRGLKCHICEKTFTQKSSLIRHSKRCTPGPAPSLRQKSCRQCTTSKTRCDLRRPKCSRCEQRDTSCEYIIPMTRGARLASSPAAQQIGSGSYENIPFTMDLAPVSFAEAPQALLGLPENTSVSVLNLLANKGPPGGLQLSFPPDTDSLLAPEYPKAELNTAKTSSGATPDDCEFNSDDWLLWNPGPSGSTPPLVKHSMETLLRVMKTWPRMLAKEIQSPPMIHFSHADPSTVLQPMANCITIAKMWVGQSDASTEIVRQAVIQEMRALFETYRTMDERHLLSALQALVFYTMILLFPGKGQIAVSLVDPAIFLSLQRVVSYVASTGLILTEERDHERPSWESWVHVTAKRRAVFSLYLLHWSYSVYHGFPSFECSQLGFMPAPAPKYLWQAETREKWEDLYNRWLAQWGESPYMMREFAGIQAGPVLERRTELWLEDADELGILFFSIGTTVHPCVEWW